MYPRDREEFRLALKEAVAEQPDARYYLSGAGSFLGETLAVLTELGVTKKQIKTDKFRGY